jgi:hypothetical protein
VKSVQVAQGDKKRLEMRCEFDGSSPIPTHVHVEEYRLGAKLPWETNDVTIARAPLTKEDEAMFEIKVDSTFTIFDYRVNSGEPIQYRGSEINKLLKK